MIEVLGKLQEGLAKTRQGVWGSITRIITGTAGYDDGFLQEMEETLIAGDIGVATAERIVHDLRQMLRSEKVYGAENFLAILKNEIVGLLTEPLLGHAIEASSANPIATAQPYVIMVVGVNGTGKTTTIGKLAYRFGQEGRKVLIAAADTFRAAASEQLEIWAQRAGAEFVRNQPGADPAAVAFDALKAAAARGMDVLLVDTAGRLHTKINLMEELRKIHRVLGKAQEGAPHEVLLVLDATTGQNGLSQARLFRQAVGITGIVLAKLDGTAKGGIVLAIQQELGVPVKYVGIGEKIEDLQKFDPEAFVEALFA